MRKVPLLWFIRSGCLFLAITHMAVAEQTAAWLAVAPLLPVRGDWVRVQLVLGTAVDGYAPWFDSLDVSTEDGKPVGEYPSQRIALHYRSHAPDSNPPPTADSVRYGPVFDLGVLDSGYYLLYDGTNWDTLALWYVPPEPGGGITITGSIGRAGAPGGPLAGAVVRLSAPDVVYTAGAKEVAATPYTTMRVARTDSSGSFDFGDLGEGIYRIVVTRQGYFGWETQRAVSADIAVGTDLVRAQSFGTIVGRVMAFDCPTDSLSPDCGQVPVGGCSVRLLWSDGSTLIATADSAHTDSAGDFRIDSAAIADTVMWAVARHPHFAPETLVVRPREGLVTQTEFLFDPSYRHMAVRTHGNLTFTLRSRSRAYPQNEQIGVTFEVTNTGTSDTVVSFDKACLPVGYYQLRYQLESAEGQVLELPPDENERRICTALQTTVVLGPGESIVRDPAEFGQLLVEGKPPDSICIVAWVDEYRELSETRLWVYAADTAMGRRTSSFSVSSRPVCCRIHGTQLVLNIDRTQHVDAAAFDFSGRRTAVVLSTAMLGAGTHRIALDPCVDGGRPCLLRVAGEGWTTTLRTMWMP